MVVGNSVGYFLAGEGFSKLKRTPPVVTLNAALVACVYPFGTRFRSEPFGRGTPSNPCDHRDWAAKVRTFVPDVVLMAFNDSGGIQLLHRGRWLSACDPGYRDWYLSTLQASTRVLSSRGARVVMITSAYSTSLGAAESTRRQTDCKNAITREFAAAHHAVGFVDLAHFVCPSISECHRTIDGVEMRKDGVHYRGPSARLVARWLLPQINISRTRRRALGT